jgi:hypothetical protein
MQKKVLKAVGTVPKNGFSQKALYRLFSKKFFFYVGEVPNTFYQNLHMDILKVNFRSKKALCPGSPGSNSLGQKYCLDGDKKLLKFHHS